MSVRSYSELTGAPSIWPEISAWIAEARTDVTVLPASQDGRPELYALQVPISTPLGAIVVETAGILVDHGWLRILGGGAPDLPNSIARWNGLLPGTSSVVPGALLVGWDVLGGLFAINDTALPGARGAVHYFRPDTLDWFDTGMAYRGFLRWAFSGRVSQFSADLRWPGWEAEVSPLPADQGLLAYPFPWSVEGRDIAAAQRSAVPAGELLRLYLSMSQQMPRQQRASGDH